MNISWRWLNWKCYKLGHPASMAIGFKTYCHEDKFWNLWPMLNDVCLCGWVESIIFAVLVARYRASLGWAPNCALGWHGGKGNGARPLAGATEPDFHIEQKPVLRLIASYCVYCAILRLLYLVGRIAPSAGQGRAGQGRAGLGRGCVGERPGLSLAGLRSCARVFRSCKSPLARSCSSRGAHWNG